MGSMLGGRSRLRSRELLSLRFWRLIILNDIRLRRRCLILIGIGRLCLLIRSLLTKRILKPLLCLILRGSLRILLMGGKSFTLVVVLFASMAPRLLLDILFLGRD